MTLIVAPAADAESYCSVEAATAYHAGLGNATWAALATDELRGQMLRRATIYMTGMYGQRWIGGVGDLEADAVPAAVRNACAELALRAIAGPLLADQGAQVKSEAVGPLSVTYADGARQETRYAAVEAMLAAYFRSGGNSIKLVRA